MWISFFVVDLKYSMPKFIERNCMCQGFQLDSEAEDRKKLYVPEGLESDSEAKDRKNRYVPGVPIGLGVRGSKEMVYARGTNRTRRQRIGRNEVCQGFQSELEVEDRKKWYVPGVPIRLGG